MLAASLGQSVFILTVALVNLGLGFGLAMWLGRGPWSVRARSAARKEETSDTDRMARACVGTPGRSESDEDARPWDEQVVGCAGAEAQEPGAEPRGEPAEAPSVDTVAVLVERIEQRLESWLEQWEQGTDADCETGLQEWQRLVQGVACELEQAASQLSPGGSDGEPSVAPDLIRKTVRLLQSLAAQFAENGDEVVRTPRPADFVTAWAQKLIEACRDTRGAVNAVLFSLQEV